MSATDAQRLRKVKMPRRRKQQHDDGPDLFSNLPVTVEEPRPVAPPKVESARHEYPEGFVIGDAVLDSEGFHGTVVAPLDEPSITDKHVFVMVGRNHPQAWMGKPVPYSVDRLRRVKGDGTANS